MKQDFYIYVLCDPTKPGAYNYYPIEHTLDFEPYYLGKGRGDRYISHNYEARKFPKRLKNVRMVELMAMGINPSKYAYKIFTGLDEKSAYRVEAMLIMAVGMSNRGHGPLLNAHIGGSGGCYGNYSKIPKELFPELKRLYSTGLTSVQLARLYKVSKPTMLSCLHQAFGDAFVGHKAKPIRKLSLVEDKQLCARYLLGETCMELSIAYSIGTTTVKTILLREGVTIRAPNDSTKLAKLRRSQVPNTTSDDS
jgi:hypothetical protein